MPHFLLDVVVPSTADLKLLEKGQQFISKVVPHGTSRDLGKVLWERLLNR